MRALARELAEVRRIAAHLRLGRIVTEGATVVAFVVSLGFLSMIVATPREGSPRPTTGYGVQMAEVAR